MSAFRHRNGRTFPSLDPRECLRLKSHGRRIQISLGQYRGLEQSAPANERQRPFKLYPPLGDSEVYLM